MMLGPKFFRITYDLSPNIIFPKMIRTHLERGIASCATGYDRLTIKRSLGEAIERHLSFSDSDHGIKKMTISEMDPIISEWFERSVSEIVEEDEFRRHAYNVVDVIELYSGKRYLAPLVAFNLGAGSDDDFYGFRDSSGSAFHPLFDLVMKNSRNEYCERQALPLFWYFGHCVSYVNLAKSKKYGDLLSRLPFTKEMLKEGDIYLFDISVFYPVRTILSVYFSTLGSVRFSAGASGGEDIELTISKSLCELYQAYVLMLNLNDHRTGDLIEINDPIISGYMSYNNEKTSDKFKYFLGNDSLCVERFPDTIEFIKDFNNESIFCFSRNIRLMDAEVFYSVMKSVNGFNAMGLNDYNRKNFLIAANHYGYNRFINDGSIPFA